MHYVVTSASSQNEDHQISLEVGASKTRTGAVQSSAVASSSRLNLLPVGIAVAVLAASAGTARAESPISDGRYVIRNRLTSSVMYNAREGTTNAEITVLPEMIEGQAGQSWRLRKAGDYWEIRNEDGYLCLTHDTSSEVAYQSVCNDHSSQRFKLWPSTYMPGYFHIVANGTGKLLSTYYCTSNTQSRLTGTQGHAFGSGCDEWLFEKTNYTVETRKIEVGLFEHEIDGPYWCTLGWHFLKYSVYPFMYVFFEKIGDGIYVDEQSPDDINISSPEETGYSSNLYFNYTYGWKPYTGQVRYACVVN